MSDVEVFLATLAGRTPMTQRVRDDVKRSLDAFGREFSYARKPHSWYRRQAETVAVVDLQRSNYGPHYYVNVALWLLPLGAAKTPPHNHCHVMTRLDELLPEQANRMKSLLDAASGVDFDDRRRELGRMLAHADGLLTRCSTIAGFASPDGQELLSRSLIMAEAQDLLT